MIFPIKPTKINLKKLHKKFGQLIVSMPTESDVNEGNYLAHLYFRDDEGNVYLLLENDIRQPTEQKVKE